MEQIHDVESKKIQILIYVYERSYKWIQVKEIADKLDVSVTKMRGLLLSLKNDLNEFEIEMELITSKNKGIKLQNASSKLIQLFKEHLYKKTFEYSLLIEFFHGSYINHTQYCMDNFISIASLRRKLNQLNRHLEKYHVLLKKNDITGDESSIRSFLAQYFWEIHEDHSWPFKTIEKQKVLDVITLIEEKLGIFLTENDRERFSYVLAVSRLRQENKHYILDKSTECGLFAKGNKFFLLFASVIAHLVPQTVYLENELEYLFYIFFGFHLNYESITAEKLIDIWQTINQQNCEATSISKRIISRIEQEFQIEDLQIESSIFHLELNTVCQHAFIFSPNILMADRLEYSSNIKNKFPLLYRKILTIIDETLALVVEKFDKEWIIEYLSLIVHASKNFNQFGKKIKISIISSFGKLNEKVLSNFIRQQFLYDYNLEFVSRYSTYDILITDIHGLIKNEKYILILEHHKLTQNDFSILENYFEAISKKQIRLSKKDTLIG